MDFANRTVYSNWLACPQSFASRYEGSVAGGCLGLVVSGAPNDHPCGRIEHYRAGGARRQNYDNGNRIIFCKEVLGRVGGSMIQLSNRLQVIADLVPEGCVLADIGTDHALLPVYLAQTKRIAYAIAGELNQGPYEAACTQVKRYGLEAKIAVRKGSGLAVIKPGEAETVTIAGMGGALIADILEDGYRQGKLEGVQTLILQPNVADDLVRSWLLEHGYALLDERIIIEDGVPYVILYAQKDDIAGVDPQAIYEPRRLSTGFDADKAALLKFGPYLLERMEPPFIEKWQAERTKLTSIKQHIHHHSESSEAARRLQEIDEQIAQITEVLQCSPKVKQSHK